MDAVSLNGCTPGIESGHSWKTFCARHSRLVRPARSLLWADRMLQAHEAAMSDKRQTVGVMIAILAITSLPYLYAYLIAGPDLVYTGLMFDVPDHAQYWSWVTASRKALFISNTMTPEPNNPLF